MQNTKKSSSGVVWVRTLTNSNDTVLNEYLEAGWQVAHEQFLPVRTIEDGCDVVKLIHTCRLQLEALFAQPIETKLLIDPSDDLVMDYLEDGWQVAYDEFVSVLTPSIKGLLHSHIRYGVRLERQLAESVQLFENTYITEPHYNQVVVSENITDTEEMPLVNASWPITIGEAVEMLASCGSVDARRVCTEVYGLWEENSS